MVKITDKEKELITKLGDPYYTVSNIEKWINRNDNVFAILYNLNHLLSYP